MALAEACEAGIYCILVIDVLAAVDDAAELPPAPPAALAFCYAWLFYEFLAVYC